MRTRKTSDIAYSAVFVALSVIICSIASLFPTMTLAITAVAGIAVAFVILRSGYKYAILVYVASSILVLLLVPNKEAAVYYIFLFGHYPMLKLFFERIKAKALMWIIKLLSANVLYYIVFLLSTYLLGIFEQMQVAEFAATAIVFNVAFVLYDISLGRIMMLLISKRAQNNRFR